MPLADKLSMSLLVVAMAKYFIPVISAYNHLKWCSALFVKNPSKILSYIRRLIKKGFKMHWLTLTVTFPNFSFVNWFCNNAKPVKCRLF